MKSVDSKLLLGLVVGAAVGAAVGYLAATDKREQLLEDIIRELVILTTDGGDDALIRIKGKIKPSDIEKVINDHKDGC